MEGQEGGTSDKVSEALLSAPVLEPLKGHGIHEERVVQRGPHSPRNVIEVRQRRQRG